MSDIFTLDENNNAAVRTVGVKAGAVESNQPDIFTTDENGNAAVRVVGGGDSSNLGYFTTLEALQEAYPTAEPGNWAIVGSTDTVWIWDDTTSAWVDSDKKGQVTSVNNQTGAVTLDINDVAPTQTGKSGYVLGTDGFVAGWVRPEQIQRSALPQASEEEVDKIYQYVGTTDANYTNGYFYKCVSDGGNPATYSWVRLDVQPTPSGLPSQTGQSGKFLTTDGTDASWSGNLVLLAGNTQIGFDSSYSGNYNVVIGNHSNCGYGNYETAIGSSAFTTANYTLAVGANSNARQANSIALGARTSANATNAIQLGSTGAQTTNSDADTFKVANTNGNFEIMSADGTIPEARLADTTNATTGQALVLDSNLDAVWTDVDSLPSQTGNAGKFLKTDGTNATWENITTSPATAPTLVAANWSSNTQTITVQGVTATNTVIVSPIPTDAEDYAAAGILCTGQATNALTFTCQTTPASDLQVNIVIM